MAKERIEPSIIADIEATLSKSELEAKFTDGEPKHVLYLNGFFVDGIGIEPMLTVTRASAKSFEEFGGFVDTVNAALKSAVGMANDDEVEALKACAIAGFFLALSPIHKDQAAAMEAAEVLAKCCPKLFIFGDVSPSISDAEHLRHVIRPFLKKYDTQEWRDKFELGAGAQEKESQGGQDA